MKLTPILEVAKEILKKALAFSIFLFFISNSGAIYAGSGISQFQTFSSNPEDRFTISVPLGWNSKIIPNARGKMYAFWDGVGNALTIDVGTPDSFKKLLNAIADNKISKTQLSEIQQLFRREAPLKPDVLLSISTIANKKALTQTYTHRQETLDIVVFVRGVQHDFLHEGKQYIISYSSTPAFTSEAAKANLETSFQRYFKPMLVTFFVQ